MMILGYCIVDPKGDRPYFSHSPPTDYQKAGGAKVYSFSFEVPDPVPLDDHFPARAVPLEP